MFSNRTKKISFNGETHSITEWAKKLGVSSACISRRLSIGWPLEQVLSVTTIAAITFNGETHTVAEWAQKIGVLGSTRTATNNLRRRLAKMTVEQALTSYESKP